MTQVSSNQWSLWYFNHYLVDEIAIPDGLVAALRGFSLYSLAKGRAEAYDNGKFHVTVTDVYVFARDLFQFEPGKSYRYWSCPLKDWSVLFVPGISDTSFEEVTSQDLINFQDNHNYGNDFQVMSNAHRVNDFQGIQFTYSL
jgi:hypothetical protein